MKSWRTVCGIAALVGLAAGFNLLVLRQTLLAASVYVPLAVGVVAGLLWLALALRWQVRPLVQRT